MVSNNGDHTEGEPLGELEQWVRYKKECAVEFVLEEYSVEWPPNEENWITVYRPGRKVDGIPEYRAWAKFFMEPSQYGVGCGRVSKLCIRRITPPLDRLLGGSGEQKVLTLYNYDRGLDVDILDESPPARSLYDVVLNVLN